MKHRIVILEPGDYSPAALEAYGAIGAVTCCEEHPPDRGTLERATVLVCRLACRLDESLLDGCRRLRYIVSPTTGLNHIDLDYCEARNIAVLSLRGETAFLDSIRSTSELTFALILALVRNIVPGVLSVRRSRWNRDEFKGRELSSLTLGVLGAGRIGRHVIGYGHAFGMTVLACDPFVTPERARVLNAEFVSREDLFARADVVTVHVDYRPENEGMITRSDFERMKPGGCFVNTSRGELAVEDDIVWALETGRLRGAALDVLSGEQDRRSIFRKKIVDYAETHDNLIITPHIGGCTSDAMHNTERFMAEKLARAVRVAGES